MNLNRPQKIDFTVYQSKEVYTALLRKTPIVARLLALNVREVPVPPALELLSKQADFSNQAYAYILSLKAKEQITPNQVISAAIVQGLGVTPGADSVSIGQGEESIELRLYKGDPEISEESARALSKILNKSVMAVQKSEIAFAQTIVDYTKVVKGKVESKNLTAGSLLSMPKENAVNIEGIRSAVEVAFGSTFADLNTGTLLGEPYTTHIYSKMGEINRSEPAYKEILTDVVRASRLCRFRLANKVGDHVEGSLGYAYKVMHQSRGIRNSDKSDSTAGGGSTYLNFNITRPMMKSVIRAQDALNVYLALKRPAALGFIGSMAIQYVRSIISVQAFSKVTISLGLIDPAKIGWALKDPDSDIEEYGHPDHPTLSIVPILRDMPVLNVDLKEVNAKEPWLVQRKLIPSSYDVQMVPVFQDFSQENFMPSVAIHSMIGYVFKGVASIPPYNPNQYLSAVVRLNFMKTLPSFFAERGTTVVGSKMVNYLLKPVIVWDVLKSVTKYRYSYDDEGDAELQQVLDSFVPPAVIPSIVEPQGLMSKTVAEDMGEESSEEEFEGPGQDTTLDDFLAFGDKVDEKKPEMKKEEVVKVEVVSKKDKEVKESTAQDEVKYSTPKPSGPGIGGRGGGNNSRGHRGRRGGR